MSGSRKDVQQLFRHFGLDPASYIDLSGAAAGPDLISAQLQSRTGDRKRKEFGDRDLFDYRNYDLAS